MVVQNVVVLRGVVFAGGCCLLAGPGGVRVIVKNTHRDGEREKSLNLTCTYSRSTVRTQYLLCTVCRIRLLKNEYSGW